MCYYIYSLYLFMLLSIECLFSSAFVNDGSWRKSLGADDIHDDVAIIRRGRLQWMLFHCVDGCRPTLHDAFWRDVFACVTSFVSLKMMSPRLIRHRLRDLWWWRALAQADWDGLGGAGSSSWCQLWLWRRLLKNAVIEPWSLCSWRTLLKVVIEGQYRLSTFVSVKISHFYPWATINYHKQIFSINYQRPRRDSSSLVVFNALIFLSLNCVKGLLLCMSMII